MTTPDNRLSRAQFYDNAMQVAELCEPGTTTLVAVTKYDENDKRLMIMYPTSQNQ